MVVEPFSGCDIGDIYSTIGGVLSIIFWHGGTQNDRQKPEFGQSYALKMTKPRLLAALVGLDKSSALQGLGKPVQTVQAFFDIGHAGGVAQADVIVRAEGDAGYGGHLFLLQQFRAEPCVGGALNQALRESRQAYAAGPADLQD